MATEYATHLAGLNDTKPANTELVAEGDDHLRLLKNVLQTTFPGRGVTDMAPITKTINFVPGVNEVGALYVINGATTCTMPVASGLAPGTHYWVWTATTDLTVATSDGTLVNGAASGTVEAGFGAVITFDGTNWILVAVGPGPAGADGADGSGGGLDFGSTLNSWGGENTVNPTGTSNTAIGSNVLTLNTGDDNSGFGSEVLAALASGSRNTALGSKAGKVLPGGSSNTFVGHEVADSLTYGNGNTVIGQGALTTSTASVNDSVIGYGAMGAVASSGSNVAIGYQALYAANNPDKQIAIGAASMPIVVSSIGTTPSVAIGNKAAELLTTGDGNVCIGAEAGYKLVTGSDNVFIGTWSGNRSGGTGAGERNVAVGWSAFAGSGGYNCAFGASTLTGITTGSYNTAIGYDSLDSITTETNCSGLGYGADVTGSNQVQLGNSSTTTYAYGAVANRSDARDKADVRSTSLGLAFILALRPVEFRWDYREDYAWGEKDGSKTRSRFHQGFIAQDVKKVLEEQRVDFGGFQDHAIAGGKDVMSLGYTEFIAPLVKAIQELAAEFAEYKRTHP